MSDKGAAWTEAQWSDFGRAMGYSGEELREFRAHPNNEYVVQNDAIAALCHLLSKDLAWQHRADDVQVKHPAQRVNRQIEKGEVGVGGGLRFVAARRVHQAIDFPEFFRDLIRGLAQRVLTSSTSPKTTMARPTLD